MIIKSPSQAVIRDVHIIAQLMYHIVNFCVDKQPHNKEIIPTSKEQRKSAVLLDILFSPFTEHGGEMVSHVSNKTADIPVPSHRYDLIVMYMFTPQTIILYNNTAPASHSTAVIITDIIDTY